MHGMRESINVASAPFTPLPFCFLAGHARFLLHGLSFMVLLLQGCRELRGRHVAEHTREEERLSYRTLSGCQDKNFRGGARVLHRCGDPGACS